MTAALRPRLASSSGRWPAWCVLLLGCLTPLAFAACTGQTWEDFYISYRHAVNLVHGHGPSYRPDARIQGFSSPLAMLLQAGSYLLARGSAQGGFEIFRCLGAGAFALGLLGLVRTLERQGLGRAATGLAALLYCLEVKSIAFSVDGMETGFVLAFLSGVLMTASAKASGRTEVVAGAEAASSGITVSAWRLGALWGGLMWARADGCVYVGLTALGCLALPDLPRRSAVRRVLAAGLAGALVYLPWLVFAWAWYGSPVPLTVLAKRPAGPWPTAGTFLQALCGLPGLWSVLWLPPYAQFGGWDAARPLSLVLGAAGSLAWLGGRALPRPARRASLASFGASVYLAALPQYSPWYLPPVVLLALPGIAAGLDRLLRPLKEPEHLPDGPDDRPDELERFPNGSGPSPSGAEGNDLGGLGPAGPGRRWGRPRLALLGLGAGAVLVLAWLAWDYALEARVATEVAEGQRRAIGTWLAQHAGPDDRVYLECPGNIGFHAGLTMLDWPGLVSPEVLQARRTAGDDMASVGRALQPEWLVLRPGEAALFEGQAPGWLKSRYLLIRAFDVSSELRQKAPTHPELLYDAVFLVLRRR